MAKKLRVGVIFGGRSGEHEVSLRSARSIIEAMDERRYDVVPIGITKEGRWLTPSETTVRLLPDQVVNDESKNDAVAILGDPSRKGLIGLDRNDSIKEADSNMPLDVIFPVLHGTFGEDGTIQGLLEMAAIPYVGCGVLASACGMDKVTMKALFRDAGLPICSYLWFTRAEWTTNNEKILRRVKREIDFPCFVKPANLGSSVGISRADDRESLTRAINLAARYDRKIIVETGLDAREIECAVLGNDDPVASLPGEYIVKDERARFLDYTEKYSNTGNVEFTVPAPISARQQKQIQQMAVKAFRSIDGAGIARVDFFLTRDTNELLLNELNTMPGFTPASGYPKMWAASGLPLPKLIDRLIELALELHRDKALNETSL
jgi:D-alanine-D-alanine ligase